jgi:hypothetical protein
MLRHTNGFVGLLLQTLMVIPSGLAWAQTTIGAAHFYTTLGGIHVAGYPGLVRLPRRWRQRDGMGPLVPRPQQSAGPEFAGDQPVAEGGSK